MLKKESTYIIYPLNNRYEILNIKLGINSVVIYQNIFSKTVAFTILPMEDIHIVWIGRKVTVIPEK